MIDTIEEYHKALKRLEEYEMILSPLSQSQFALIKDIMDYARFCLMQPERNEEILRIEGILESKGHKIKKPYHFLVDIGVQ